MTTGASDDIAKATEVARTMVVEWGMSELGLLIWMDSKDIFMNRQISLRKWLQD